MSSVNSAVVRLLPSYELMRHLEVLRDFISKRIYKATTSASTFFFFTCLEAWHIVGPYGCSQPSHALMLISIHHSTFFILLLCFFHDIYI